MDGKILPLEEIEDAAFSSKAMGDGFAIELSGDEVVAPVSGEIVMSFPTGHAYGIKSDDGKEILIHIGMDTVELNGEGFDVKVKAGQRVKQGDVLVKVNKDILTSHGKSLVSPVVFTSGEKVELHKKNETITKNEKGFIAFI
ncbi:MULTISPECIES: PTS sugar transporter subunit IIA [Bacillota]